MKKILFVAIVGLALCAVPNTSVAAPPGFYAGATFVSPFPAYPVYPFATGPTTTTFNYYTSPYGYRAYNSSTSTPTPWGWSSYQTQGTFITPYVNGPTHSVYWDPFANTYQYSYPTGYVNGVTYTPGRRLR